MQLQDIQVRPVTAEEEPRFAQLMRRHHYLESAPKIGETLWYIAHWQGHWIALLTFTSAAWKCALRDRWIGWRWRHQFDRLNLITNNSRFLILPQWHYPNAATRILALCRRRLQQDWQQRFGHPVLLLETFVDPQRFQGTLYQADNWIALGHTQGFSRAHQGYSATAASPKRILVYPLQRNTRKLLSQPFLDPRYHCGAPQLMISAHQMSQLPDFFRSIPDPRRAQGQRHRLSTVLAIATGAILCGRQGYKGIAEWARGLGQKARARFNCRHQGGTYLVPSESIIRNLLIRVDPQALDEALRQWSLVHGQEDESLAIDGKTMRKAIDEQGRQVHILSAIGHQTLTCHTQKKSVPCP